MLVACFVIMAIHLTVARLIRYFERRRRRQLYKALRVEEARRALGNEKHADNCRDRAFGQ
jgi:hypothetical protein